MENNQYPTVENANFNSIAAAAPEKKKSKNKLFVIIPIIVLVVIIAIVLVVFVLMKNGDKTTSERDTPTLQIYSMLDSSVPIEDLESAVKEINSNATVSFEEEYGTISMPDSENEFISFYFDPEEDEEGEDGGESNEDGMEYAPDTAYGFTYVLTIGAENNRTITCDEKLCYYYDGYDAYDYKSKDEAISAFLAPGSN